MKNLNLEGRAQANRSVHEPGSNNEDTEESLGTLQKPSVQVPVHIN